MMYFFPDSQDLVDPSFNFITEKRSDTRLRHRDDNYAHEFFSPAPYDGMLISKAIAEGFNGSGCRYTLAQRQRLLRCGAREFLRIPDHLFLMGDCGAFSYVNEKTPPITIDEVINFYDACNVDYGVSVDHVILSFKQENVLNNDSIPSEWIHRQMLTLELAEQFFQVHKSRRCRFEPIGVAQGWSPNSYKESVKTLQKIGYKYIGLGGLVPLKNQDIMSVLESVSDVRLKRTKLHLFGISRLSHLGMFSNHGVISFDSTSPFRQAFKDEKDNYYTPKRTYTAIKIPQIQGNPKLNNLIVAGKVKQKEACRLEKACISGMLRYEQTKKGLRTLLSTLKEYEQIHDANRDHFEVYRETLSDRPWEQCPCHICKTLGIHVVIFRGAERNRRRGFHNLFVTYQKLQGNLS